MTGIATPALSGVSAAPAAPAATGNPIADAGQEFLATLTEEERNRPFADPGEEEIEGAAPTPAPAEAATDVGEPITRETDGAEFNEDAGRWQLNGKFVAGAPPEGWEPPARAVAAPPAPAPASADVAPKDEGQGSGVKVTLSGLGDKGESDIELEVDPEIAERLNRLKSDAGRTRALQRRASQLDQREAELQAHQQEMDVDPVGFHLNKMPKERQLEVAQALLVEHLDDLMPVIDQLRDPSVRMGAMRQFRDGLRASQERLAQARTVSTAVREVLQATESLIPETADSETADQFIADARRDLADAAARGEPVNRNTVKAVLARRLALYGFDAPKASPPGRSPAAPAPATPTVPTARPATDRAREFAAKARPAAAASPNRIRRVQADRAAAARVPSVGPGAAPTQRIATPPEAEADVASMSKHLRTKVGLPQTWAGYRGE